MDKTTQYLVYVDVDYEGIKDEMELFEDKDDAETYMDDSNKHGEWSGIGTYKIKELKLIKH